MCLLIFYRLRSRRKVHFLLTILKALCKIFTGAGNFVTEIFFFCNFLNFFDLSFFSGNHRALFLYCVSGMFEFIDFLSTHMKIQVLVDLSFFNISLKLMLFYAFVEYRK